MSVMRCAAGYVLDFFRERVTAGDFGGDSVRRVLVTAGMDEQARRAVRAMFPGAAVYVLDDGASVIGLRRMRFDAACLSMSGGSLDGRVIALLSGARHKLLIPSPDYVYRLGIRRGSLAFSWAIIDRFAVAPLALLWFCVTAGWMYLTGLTRRSTEAER